MVQILPRTQSKGEAFAEMISGGLSGAAQGAETIRNAVRGKQERQALSEQFGDIFGKIHDPDTRKQLLMGEIEKRNQAEKLRGEFAADEGNYGKIKDAFGQKFADVWRASPTGARTALTQAALEARARGLDLEQLLGQTEPQLTPKNEQTSKNMIQLPFGESFAFPEIAEPPGLTPKESVKYRSDIRNDNRAIHKENIDKNRGLKDTSQHLNILDDLNEKMDEGLGRLAIDKEGNIRPSALRFKLVPKEYERFSKTVNDFLTSAKDIFGARVTNYDIAQFKSRLPTLLNSKEGRREIIKQMKILNQIERNYRNALNQIYRHYGLEGIPEEQAEAMAEQMTAPEEERLRSQLMDIGNEGLSGTMIDVIGPDGSEYEVDESQVGELPEGFRLK